MKNLKALFVVFLLIIISISASAESYRSFEFQNRSLEGREDISAVYSGLSTKITKEEARSLKKLSVASIDMYVFKEVADLMERGSHPAGSPWQALKAPTLCEEHKSFKLEELPRIKNSCPFTKLAFKSLEKDQNLFLNCQNAYQPELYVDEIPAGEVKINRISHLSGLIQTMAWPLRYMNLPENLITQDMLIKMRFLLTKIRMEDLQEKIQRNKEMITSVMNGLNHERCFDLSINEMEALKTKVNHLHSEILAAENYLKQIDEEGRRQAELDREKVLATGKTRAILPYPNLTDSDREYITMYLSSIMWRLRGGGVVARTDTTQFRRIFYTWRPVNLIARLNGGDDGQGTGFRIFLGLMKMWGRYFDMGTYAPDEDRYYDLTKMTERGLFQVKFANKFLERNGYSTNYMTMAGLQMGPLYYYATYSGMRTLKYPGRTEPPFREAIGGSTDWGELLFGANLGIALSRTFLQGHD